MICESHGPNDLPEKGGVVNFLPVAASLGAEVEGIDLGTRMNDAEVDALVIPALQQHGNANAFVVSQSELRRAEFPTAVWYVQVGATPESQAS